MVPKYWQMLILSFQMEIKRFTVVIYFIFKMDFLGDGGGLVMAQDVYAISMEKMDGKYHIGCQFFQADFWSQFKNFPQAL